MSNLENKKELPSYFDFTGDINDTAYLNWRFDSTRTIPSQMSEMGNAYYETALHLLNECINDNIDNKADSWIFPILFNVVHGIEVFLKSFNSQIQTLELLVTKQEVRIYNIEGRHDILQLVNTSISKFNKYLEQGINLGSLEEIQVVQKELNLVKKFIEILYENTDDMTFARYPITSKKEKHFYNDDSPFATNENITIDLNTFKLWIIDIFSILRKITDHSELLIDHYFEMLSDLDY